MWKIFFEQLQNPLVKILFITGVVSLIMGYFSTQRYKWLESLSILLAITLATGIQATCDYGKDRQFARLAEAALRTKATVIRGQYGTPQEIPASDLVVGDIIKLKAGDRVPADCLMFEEHDMKVDEHSVLGKFFSDQEFSEK